MIERGLREGAERPKARHIKSDLVLETQASGNFITSLNSWFSGAGEKDLVALYYQFDGTTHSALILYAE